MQLQLQKVLVPNAFQTEALAALEEYDKINDKGIVVMPTGTGKTFLAALWFKKKLEKNPTAKLLFVCHNQDILSQANEREFQNCLKDLDITYGYYNAYRKEHAQCLFGTVQTLVKNLRKFSKTYFTYIIVDEAHHYQANTFKKVLDYFKPNFMLGLTATPTRMDGKNILKICGNKIYESKIGDAIQRELLSKIIYYCVDNDIDFSKIKYENGNYSEKDLNKKICIKEYDDAILNEYKKTVRDKYEKKKTICFCATVKHAYRMNKVFNENGIKTICFTGMDASRTHTLKKDKRKEIIDGFKKGKYEIIFVRDLFNEGVDIPDADCIMMLRPTQSHTIFTQQIGRGLRKAKGKENVLVLDFTGNAKKCIINFEVLQDFIGVDIIKIVKKSESNLRGDLIIIENGCEVRLSKVKLNIIKSLRTTPTKEQLIAEYFDLKKKLGRQPTCRDTRSDGFYHRMFYGSFANFLISIGEIPKQNHIKASKEELIKQYFDIKKTLGRQPVTEDMRIAKGVKWSLKKYERMWGNWNNFLRAIKEPLNPNVVSARDVTKKKLIENYFDIKKKLDKRPISTDFKIAKGSKFGPNIYTSKFGSWIAFLKEINEPYRELNIPKEEIIKALRNKAIELGHIPSSIEFGNRSIILKEKFGCGWEDIIRKVFGKDAKYDFYGSKTIHKTCPVCHKKYTHFSGNKKLTCSRKCFNVYKYKTTLKGKEKEIIKRYKNGEGILEIAKGVCHNSETISNFLHSKNIKTRSRSEQKRLNYLKRIKDKDIQENNIRIISNYKPKIIIPISKTQKQNKNCSYTDLKHEAFKTTKDKIGIREKIISKIQDGDSILLLESPELAAIKEIEKQNKHPSKIIIPNNKEFEKLVVALRNYKTKLNIEVVRTSALQYLIDTDEKFDFIWLDYCGAFSYYIKDLDILFQKQFDKIKLILTYNLFDPIKEDDSYYFTRVIDYILEKANSKQVRLINDITYRYKKNMYNLGFTIQNDKILKEDIIILNGDKTQ